MSKNSMLQQAIIDADELKEAALKNAEELLIEKYSSRIEEAVDSMLEQDDEEEDIGDLDAEMDDLSSGGMDLDMEGGMKSDVSDDIPYAALDGENCNDCLNEEEEIEIDFNELEKQINKEEPQAPEKLDVGEVPMAADSLEDEMPSEEDDELMEEEIELDEDSLKELTEDEDVVGESVRLPPVEPGENKKEKDEEELDEEETINEDDLSDLLEEVLEVDILDSGDNGWMGSNDGDRVREVEEELIRAKQDEVQEELKNLKKSIKDLQESKQKDSEKIKKIVKENKSLKVLLHKVKNTIQETNLKNKKLHYTNKVLRDTSLNERQREELVEAISKVDLVKNVEVVMETLKTAVGNKSITKKKMPKSLLEAVSKSPVSSLRGQEKTSDDKKDTFVGRMQELAGIPAKK